MSCDGLFGLFYVWMFYDLVLGDGLLIMMMVLMLMLILMLMLMLMITSLVVAVEMGFTVWN